LKNRKIVIVAIALLLGACGGDSDDSSEMLKVNILSNTAPEFEKATLRFTIFGAEENFQDGYATIIYDNEFTINEIPSTVLVEWPANDYQLIFNPPVNSPDDAIYFFNLTVDINNDGLICEGDYIRDFESSPFYTFGGSPPEEVELYVRELMQGCNYY